MNIAWYTWCGYAGALLVLLAFFLLQAHKLHGNGWIYQLMNILGPIGLILSLVFGNHNWPAFAMEAIWALIGVYGIAFNLRRRHQLPKGATNG